MFYWAPYSGGKITSVGNHWVRCQALSLVCSQPFTHMITVSGSYEDEKPMRYLLTPVRMPIIKKSTNNKYTLERVWRKGNPLALLVGMEIDTATMENSMEVP